MANLSLKLYTLVQQITFTVPLMNVSGLVNLLFLNRALTDLRKSEFGSQ